MLLVGSLLSSTELPYQHTPCPVPDSAKPIRVFTEIRVSGNTKMEYSRASSTCLHIFEFNKNLLNRTFHSK